MNFLELSPIDNRKSFCGKAFVEIGPNSIGYVLRSYGRAVCMVDGVDFYRLWDGYSMTTMRHINAFLSWYDAKTITKKEWESLPVTDPADLGIIETY